MKTLGKISLAVVVALGGPGLAQAATKTANFTVTANVVAACTISATDLAFGNYDPNAATPTDQSSTITVTCTKGASYGVDVGATPMARTMSGPSASVLNFGMYNETGRTTAFGVAAGTLGTGTPTAYTVYGRIPAGQYGAEAGAHSTTVTATVTY